MNDRWRVLLARFQLSSDFQQLELFKLTEARLAENGVAFPQMMDAMKWQVCLEKKIKKRRRKRIRIRRQSMNENKMKIR